MAILVGPTSWQYNARLIPGDFIDGGYAICKSGGVGWIVAPNTTEVSRTWYSRENAVTTAQASAACGDWFVPTCGQLQNPGYTCRTYWDSYSSSTYWSSTQNDSCVYNAFYVSFLDGTPYCVNKTHTRCVRAFRCVTY